MGRILKMDWIRLLKRLLTVIVALFGLFGAMMLIGPRPDRNEAINFDPALLGSDLDAYLSASESRFTDIRPGAQKEIIWADPATKEKTPVSIVYLHGFSATKGETRPVSDKVAAALGANLYYTRLAGHGRTGEALGAATMNSWLNDTAEAIAIGERIGEKVVVVTASTGGTLATWAASHPALGPKLAALVLISPNYAIQGASIGLLNMPWGETLLPKLLGEQRSFVPHNPEHGKWWTTAYPSKAVFPMGALLKTVSLIDFTKITTPALFMVSPEDQVIVPEEAFRIHRMWGGPKELIRVANAEDPSKHVIAGDILSPGNTQMAVDAILAFLNKTL